MNETIKAKKIEESLSYWEKFLATIKTRKATDSATVAKWVTEKRNKQIDKAQRRIKKWKKSFKETQNETTSNS